MLFLSHISQDSIRRNGQKKHNILGQSWWSLQQTSPNNTCKEDSKGCLKQSWAPLSTMWTNVRKCSVVQTLCKSGTNEDDILRKF
jgi:hypothetical protein